MLALLEYQRAKKLLLFSAFPTSFRHDMHSFNFKIFSVWQTWLWISVSVSFIKVPSAPNSSLIWGSNLITKQSSLHLNNQYLAFQHTKFKFKDLIFEKEKVLIPTLTSQKSIALLFGIWVRICVKMLPMHPRLGLPVCECPRVLCPTLHTSTTWSSGCNLP